jgi:hypothetical protein
METRRRTRRVQVASSDQASSLGVHAPSVVQTQSKAASQAFALSNALGFGMEFAGQQIQRKQGIDAEEGALAAARGEFTDEELHTMEKSAAYVRGAQKVLAKQRIVEDAAAAQEWYQTEFDKGAGVAELRAGLNDFWKSRYEGVSTGLAREITPLMADTSQKLMTAHAAFQAEQTQADVESAIVTSATAAFGNGSMNAEEWNVARQDAIALAGKDRANDLLFASIEQHVAASGDPAVWDEPYLEKLKTNPKYQQRAAKSQDDARKAQAKAFQDRTVFERAAIEAHNIERAQAGDASVLTDMRQQYADGLVDEEIVRNVHKQYANAVANGLQDEIQTKAFFDGVSAYHDLNDSDYNDLVKASYVELMQKDPENADALLADGIVKNGRMPTFMKRILDSASPSNPENFEQAYGVYNTLRQADPAGYHRLVTEETKMKFDSYEILLNDNPKNAMQMLTEVDTSRIANVDQQDYRQHLDDAISDVVDGPFFNNLDDADPSVRQLVKKRYNHMIAIGYTTDKAADFAVADIQQRYTIVKGRLWPNTAGWTEDPTPVLEYVQKSYEQTDEAGREYEVVPATGRPGHAWVRPIGSLAFGGEPVRVSDMEAGYRMDQKALRDQEAVRAQAEVKNDIVLAAKQRATGLYSLPFDNSVTGTSMREAQDDAWDALPATTRMEVIREIQREAEIEKEAAKARRDAERDRARNFESVTGIL